jgi:hypothetical protein
MFRRHWAAMPASLLSFPTLARRIVSPTLVAKGIQAHKPYKEMDIGHWQLQPCDLEYG